VGARPPDRLRAPASVFYKTTEDHPFASAGDAKFRARGAHLAIQVLALLSCAVAPAPVLAAAKTVMSLEVV
jgi:hypothetical protein